jgi:hypothetical protein
VFLNPNTGAIGLPADFFVWSWGDGPLVEVEGGEQGAAWTSRCCATATARSKWRARARAALGSPLPWLSFLDLPVTTQAVYQVLVLIPIGALLVVMLRNVVGCATFGTFMPILVRARVSRDAALWGIVLFSFIVAPGLAVAPPARAHEAAARAAHRGDAHDGGVHPGASSLVAFAAGVERALSVALFPIVIMTMMIERMSIVWEESGGAHRAAAGGRQPHGGPRAYLLFSIELEPAPRVRVPELLLVVLAAMLLLGALQRANRLSESVAASARSAGRTSREVVRALRAWACSA